MATLTQFRHDFAHQYHTVDITNTLIVRAMALAETHALRGYDAVQCAAALVVHTYRQALGMPILTRCPPTLRSTRRLQRKASWLKILIHIHDAHANASGERDVEYS
jgi:hypothetical protein